MADGDRGLKPRKVNLPSAAEWIGANLELAEVVEHVLLILAKAGAEALGGSPRSVRKLTTYRPVGWARAKIFMLRVFDNVPMSVH
jgi:hypothetical protein